MKYNPEKYLDKSKCTAAMPSGMKPGDTFIVQPPHPFAGDTGIEATFHAHVFTAPTVGSQRADAVRCTVHGQDTLTIVDYGHLPCCHVCKRVCLIDGLGTGYAVNAERTLLTCYECSARFDLDYMQTHERCTMLYLTSEDDVSVGGGPRKRWFVSNWPGSLKIGCFSHYASKGSGFGGDYPVHDAWFWLDMSNGTRTLWWMRVKGNMDCGVARRIKPRGKDMLALAAGHEA